MLAAQSIAGDDGALEVVLGLGVMLTLTGVLLRALTGRGSRSRLGRAVTARLDAAARPSGAPVPSLRGRCCKTFWLRTGPCRALGADPPRDAELRGDLACRRLGSERKYVKRIYPRDPGKAGRQFAR
jgi:hypothetical protein